MAEQFQTSFIPKKTVEAETERSFSGAGLVFFIGILTLVISLVLAGGVYAYDAYLKSAKTRKEEQLSAQRKAFAPEVIREMARLSTKLSVADRLVEEHIAVSEIFQMLQDITLQTIRFSSFSFDNTPDGIQVTMQGEGLSFTSVALQADEFAKNGDLSESLFSGFALNERGNVTFSVTTTVNPRVISYRESLDRRGSATMEELFVPPAGPLVPEETQNLELPVSDGTEPAAPAELPL